MKRATEILFLSASLVYGFIAVFQIHRLAGAFHLGLAKKGISLNYEVPHYCKFISAMILLYAIQLLASVFMGLVGVRLMKGRIWHLGTASFIALFAFPIGTAAGVAGLLYLESSLKNSPRVE